MKRTIDEIPKYEIHRKLKPGKDYPSELEKLIDTFNGQRGPIVIQLNRLGQRHYKRELALIEKLFKNFFFYRSRVVKFQKYFDVRITPDNRKEWDFARLRNFRKDFHEEWKKEFGSENPTKIIDRCIAKINAKLKLTNPQLLRSDNGYRIEPMTITDKRYFRRDAGDTIYYWEYLAKIIASLNPRLVKQCSYCKKMFISRQWKMYHPECSDKFFSENSVKKGLAKERVKRSRVRLKQKAKPI